MRLPKKDISYAGVVLADAFRDDPLWQTFFKGESDINNKMRFCFETVLRYCHKFGEVYATSPNLEGVAAWVPGHLSYMTLWKMIRSGAIFPGMRMGTDAGRKMSAVFSPLEYDRKANMKGNAFVYLFIIGVGNQWQGRGFGGMLLRGLIDRCDTAGDAIYLETEMARNVAFYERFGFNVIQQVLLPVVDHPMWQMVRKPGG